MDSRRQYRADHQGRIRRGDVGEYRAHPQCLSAQGRGCGRFRRRYGDLRSEGHQTISAKKQISRIDYNVFEGFACTGLPRATLSAGKITWLDGDLRAEAGAGKYVPREPFPAVHVANATWRELNAPRRVERAEVTP